MAKSKPKAPATPEEEEVVSNEEEEFLTMELEEVPEEEEEQAPRFSLKQKLILIGTGVFSFLLFVLLLFPYEQILRSAISSGGALPVTFRDLKVSILFGEVSVKSLDFSGSSLRVKASEASIQAGLFSLLRKKVNGKFEVEGIKLDYDSEPLGSIDSLQGFIKLDSMALPMSRQNGSFELEMPSDTRAFLPGIPELPFLGKIENFRIQKLILKSALTGGNLEIKEFILDTSVARFDVSGSIRLSDTLGFSQLSLRICMELERNFALEREDIAGMLALLEKNGGGKCIPIGGILQKPDVKIPGLSGGAGASTTPGESP
ncbi:type II secretion system protein GspN [Leptospira perolatii]|uniref:Type II secretion system protein GspN n=1 Tax=Leptospira perolatii TaxID=2023191 RepID=A0A2M9ZIL8_9LEPT|nr:type II secretion system protein GspN [Leptospira perolatii]PJZ68532.1 type II secretion system protein GspN [Leptospira perolatii]PJZ71862.1 type II secretion system protein GspN [Leptospira perolatii]